MLDSATVGIGPLVAAVLQELVDEVAVRSMQLDTIEARDLRPLSFPAIVFDNAVNFVNLQRTVR